MNLLPRSGSSGIERFGVKRSYWAEL